MTIARVRTPGFSVGDKVTSTELNGIESNTEAALDKRSGRTDTLASTVTLSGIIQASGGSAKLAAVSAGAKIRTETGGRLELADNDYPQLAVGHTGRTVTRCVHEGPWVTKNKITNSTSVGLWEVNAAVFGTGQEGCGFLAVDTGDATTAKAAVYYIDSVVPNGATITSVQAVVEGSSTHSGLPALMPRLRVQDTAMYTLHSSGDYVSDTSASVGAYEAQHTITATCDQNNVVDKTSAYRILASVSNEGGTNAIIGFTIAYVKVTFTITDLRTF